MAKIEKSIEISLKAPSYHQPLTSSNFNCYNPDTNEEITRIHIIYDENTLYYWEKYPCIPPKGLSVSIQKYGYDTDLINLKVDGYTVIGWSTIFFDRDTPYTNSTYVLDLADHNTTSLYNVLISVTDSYNTSTFEPGLFGYGEQKSCDITPWLQGLSWFQNSNEDVTIYIQLTQQDPPKKYLTAYNYSPIGLTVGTSNLGSGDSVPFDFNSSYLNADYILWYNGYTPYKVLVTVNDSSGNSATSEELWFGSSFHSSLRLNYWLDDLPWFKDSTDNITLTIEAEEYSFSTVEFCFSACEYTLELERGWTATVRVEASPGPDSTLSGFSGDPVSCNYWLSASVVSNDSGYDDDYILRYVFTSAATVVFDNDYVTPLTDLVGGTERTVTTVFPSKGTTLEYTPLLSAHV